VGHGNRTTRAIAAGLAAAIGAALALAVAVSAWSPRQAGAEEVSARASDEGGPLRATIRRTEHGIPHVLAEDWSDLAFGYGYAFAEDNLCTIAESYVTVRAERSRYFGPGGSYVQHGNGFAANNLNSDFFYQRIIDDRTVEELLAQPPPQGPKPEIREGVRGYVAGYNEYLQEVGVENLPDPRCRGADWVKPITVIDAYRRFYQLALLASGTVAIDGIASAAPPPSGAGGGLPDPQQLAEQLLEALGGLGLGPAGAIGSNAYGLGSEATSNGKGVVLGNPHFPWQGPERFYQSHLTIPGEVNVSGASLFGVPLILIGHTDNLAWSHTVSTAYRFTPFQEVVNPLDPTQYLYDGEFRQMERDVVTVDTGAGTETRTLYSTHHGPVFSSLAGVPLPWLPAAAFTMGDANAANFRYLNHFFEVNDAQSTEELDGILREFVGIPWVNTIAADSEGKAYYADIGTVPNVPDAKTRTCNTPLGIATDQLLRLPILNGASSACEWDTDPDSVQPGTFGPSNLPSLFRDDYTSNMNDSYWLTNPEQPLEGYARIIGDERTPRSLRTRLGLRILADRLDSGGRFDRQAVQDAVFNNRQYAAELWRDQLVGLCESAPAGFLLGSSGPVDVSEACPVLAGWDLHDDLDSNGAVLFRRFATRALSNGGLPIDLPIGLPPPLGDLLVFGTQFNASDPVNTPSGLNTLSPTVQLALADAVTDLRSAGIPLGASLRDWQYEKRGGRRIPIHGGPGGVGVFNAISASWRGSGEEPGFSDVSAGSSFVMVTQFTDGCPDDRSILTYSLSENPESPFYADQTELFSEKRWVDPPFCEDEVLAADPEVTAIEGCLPEGCDDEVEPGGGSGANTRGRCQNLVRGTRGADLLRGTAGSDFILGLRGDDRLRGRGGDDCLRGHRGRDTIWAGAGADRVLANDGIRDAIRCGPGRDVVTADPHDRVRGCELVFRKPRRRSGR
jgi:acyl-homoserine-lactone acylase